MPKKNTRPPREGTINGLAFDFCETGTEGIIWSVQDERHISADGKSWSYDGLNCLEDGDYLKIFNDAARKQVAWEGEIKLKHPPQTHFNRGVQANVSEDAWTKLFFDQKPATLILKDTWKKMKAAARRKETARRKDIENIERLCHDGVDAKPMKPLGFRRPK